jgi:predicted acylesterase/phospholipase RssA
MRQEGVIQTMKTVSLVLGSGGARGLAHIGVIHWLEENGYTIASISWCSMGALIGGMYAAGELDKFEHWVRAVTKIDIVTLLDVSWNKSGLVKGDKIINTLVELVGNQRIKDLPISYTAVAADIKVEPRPSGESIALQVILGLIKAHAAQKGSCCVAKLYAPTIADAFKIIESLDC